MNQPFKNEFPRVKAILSFCHRFVHNISRDSTLYSILRSSAGQKQISRYTVYIAPTLWPPQSVKKVLCYLCIQNSGHHACKPFFHRKDLGMRLNNYLSIVYVIYHPGMLPMAMLKTKFPLTSIDFISRIPVHTSSAMAFVLMPLSLINITWPASEIESAISVLAVLAMCVPVL